MSIGPIPWRDVIHYAQFSGLDTDLLPVFVLTMRAMDTVYLEWVDKKHK